MQRALIILAGLLTFGALGIAPAAASVPGATAGPASRLCTSGDVHYSYTVPPPASLSEEWVQLSTCATRIRPKIVSALGFTYRGGWVTSLDKITTAKSTDGTNLARAWVEAEYVGSNVISCERVYPLPAETQYHTCDG